MDIDLSFFCHTSDGPVVRGWRLGEPRRKPSKTSINLISAYAHLTTTLYGDGKSAATSRCPFRDTSSTISSSGASFGSPNASVVMTRLPE
jgi:hypothetical protein